MTTRIAIIGAGPAGSACAIGLARRGFDVTIIEARAFPRRKVCGEFISPAATPILESLIPPPDLRRLGARRVEAFTIELGERAATWPMPAPAWVLSRTTLDDALLSRARSSGVNVRQPERAARVVCATDGVRIGLAGGDSIDAELVVHADGSGRHDAAGPTPMRRGVVGAKQRLRAPIDGIRMRSAPGVYIGTVGVEGGLATMALVARSSLVKRHAGDFDALVREAWPRFDPAWGDGDWMTCGVAGSRYIAPGHRCSFRIGNAAAAVEPVGGEGIGLALWSGARLAGMLDPRDLARTHRRFARAYRARLRARRPACRLAAAALMRPRVVHAMWPVLTGAPGLAVRPWYAMTGKPA